MQAPHKAVLVFLGLLALLCLSSAMDSGSCDGGEGTCPPNSKWEELVGKTAEEAKAVIEAEAPDVTVQIMPFGSFGTMEYNPKRVRLWLDEKGKVSRTPIRS